MHQTGRQSLQRGVRSRAQSQWCRHDPRNAELETNGNGSALRRRLGWPKNKLATVHFHDAGVGRTEPVRPDNRSTFVVLVLETLDWCVATTGPFSQHANQFPPLRVLRYLCMARPISSPKLQRASHDQSRYASASSASIRTVIFPLRRGLCDAFPGGRPARAWLFFRLPWGVDFAGSLDLDCGTSSEISPPSTPPMPVIGTLRTSRQPELLGHPAVIVQRL